MTLQLAPMARVPVQELLAAKGPVVVMLPMVRTVSPMLMMARFCPVEWTPTIVAAKLPEAGFRATPVAGVGMVK